MSGNGEILSAMFIEPASDLMILVSATTFHHCIVFDDTGTVAQVQQTVEVPLKPTYSIECCLENIFIKPQPITNWESLGR